MCQDIPSTVEVPLPLKNHYWPDKENCNGSKEEVSNSCGVPLVDLTAAKDYSQFYQEKDPLKIKCTTYLKTNLLYDLATSSTTSFTEV